MMITLSVVIPVYNEEKGILEIVERVLNTREALDQAGVRLLELLVVDDGSQDRTAQVASKMTGPQSCLRIIRHARNQGYGAALKTGFSQARGDLIGFLDADGTYPPEYFPQLCRPAIEGKELVIGTRMAGADSQMPLTRRIGNRFFAGLLSLLGRQRISDSASGMRIFRRSALERIYPLPDGLNLTPVMSARAIHEGIRMEEVPIPYSERVGRSKLSVVRDGSIFLRSMIWTILTYNPVRILGMLGLAGVTFAGLVLIGLVVARLRGVTSLSPAGVAALYAAMVSAVAGIGLFALGSTFNYLVSLFNKRPIRQGLFGRPVFAQPLDRHFGWMGLASLVLGLGIAAIALVLSGQGWEISRLWLYLLGSAMLFLTGVQLILYWILMRVLEELSQREVQVGQDLAGSPVAPEPEIVPAIS